MPKVKDYMTTPVVTITKNQSIADALKLMDENRTDGLVVVGENGASKKITGLISMYDILRHLVPDYLEKEKHLAPFEPDEIFTRRAREIKDHKVHQCMSPKPRVIFEGHSLIEAAVLFTEHRIHRLPVVDDKKNLVGYLSRSDVQRAIGHILES